MGETHWYYGLPLFPGLNNISKLGYSEKNDNLKALDCSDRALEITMTACLSWGIGLGIMKPCLLNIWDPGSQRQDLGCGISWMDPGSRLVASGS